MERRSFLKTVGGAAGLAVGGTGMLGAAAQQPSAELPQRPLGRTGPRLSVVGFPGLALIHYDQKEATAGLRLALDRGLNYFDVAPAYGKGVCETKMGIGLDGVDRSRYFLACKTKKRDKAGAREELDRSLELLKTDHFDLYQLHHLRWREEVEEALGPGGAIETLLEAKNQGKVKYLGFSAHTTRAALLAMQGFRFDTAMFPINFVELLRFGFGKEVLRLGAEQGVAMLAMKAMSFGAWPQGAQRSRKWWYRSAETPEDIRLVLRFALSQPGVVSAIPPSFLDLTDKAIDAAKDTRPITPEEVERLRQLAEDCGSIFQSDETKAAWHPGRRKSRGPDNPHDECCGAWA